MSELDTNLTTKKVRRKRELYRGVSVPILLSHIRNTTPFVFDWKGEEPFIQEVLNAQSNPLRPYSHDEYFRLCVAAHFTTVCSFVPTDVDNQIRHHLWDALMTEETALKMTETVFECLKWDVRRVSTRVLYCEELDESISGLNGEWFSVAAAAYSFWIRRKHTIAADLAAVIIREVDREAKIFANAYEKQDGIQALKVATTIAHNLGDLDRVLDMWHISIVDPLKELVYECGHKPTDRWGDVLYAAGELNKKMMATENHRHFELRRPKSIRRDPKLFLPLGPFFYDWGRTLAENLTLEELADVTQSLLDGWKWLSDKAKPGEVLPVGYSRAILGMMEAVPGGESTMESILPTRQYKVMSTGPIRANLSIPEDRFVTQWSQSAMKLLKKILS